MNSLKDRKKRNQIFISGSVEFQEMRYEFETLVTKDEKFEENFENSMVCVTYRIHEFLKKYFK